MTVTFRDGRGVAVSDAVGDTIERRIAERCTPSSLRAVVTSVEWVSIARYAAGFEADLAVARLESDGILAIARSNDIVGIFGPGFGGATSRGVDVLVPSDAVDAARALLHPPT